MKVIGKSNFDLETVSDFLVCDSATKYYAKRIAAFLNAQEAGGDYSQTYYVAVEDGYELYRWEP